MKPVKLDKNALKYHPNNIHMILGENATHPDLMNSAPPGLPASPCSCRENSLENSNNNEMKPSRDIMVDNVNEDIFA